MKKPVLLLSAIVSSLLTACGSDDNPSPVTSTEKYIASVQTFSSDDDPQSLTVTYNAQGKVTGVNDGSESHGLNYASNGDLDNVTGSDPFSISELYQDPYNGYEIGDVVAYDSKGNPTELRLFERDYDGTIIEEYKGFITYDSEPNPFYYTLKAAGIIEVLENVQLNFSSAPQSEELIMAKKLLFVNNPKTFVVKHQNGTIASQVTASYTYDADGYATSGVFNSSNEEGESSSSSATYTYRN
ncbi:hypothetical protein [Flavobacterium sp.]|uniref:hypothetical protein n=1 Tax=Flavobacterium sp. TaxID=239 RepID=UPI00120C9181|nr:hypothetical protein [Flavobacterium sp.]RZJ71260.1 MAG: hypothetical protein EOO49_10955 [Flavobacterium sp.]